MAEEQKTRPARFQFQGLADLKIANKISINLRILLEPIGLLKLILIFTSLFALSLSTSYSSSSGSGSPNRATCLNATNFTYTVSIGFNYPFHPPQYTFKYDPSTLNSSNSTCFRGAGRQVFTGSAEYFVAMSSFTFVIAILSFPFYIIFYVPRYDLAKYLSIIDLIITCLLVFFYILADIAWSAGLNQLSSFHSDLLNDKRSMCLGAVCDVDTAPSPVVQSYVQLSFSTLFGWVSTIILGASLWFIYKDTIVHQEKMGPLYRLSFFSSKKTTATDVPKTHDSIEGKYTPHAENDDDEEEEKELSVDIHATGPSTTSNVTH